jgi:hypothetical protein
MKFALRAVKDSGDATPEWNRSPSPHYAAKRRIASRWIISDLKAARIVR